MKNWNWLIVLVVLVFGCGKAPCPEPECPECPACAECPTCPACPDCPACPVCPALPDAVASSMIMFTSPSGPEGFYALLFIHQDGEWRQVSAGGQVGAEEPEAEVVADFLGRKALVHLRDNPTLAGTVRVQGAEDFVCHQRGPQLLCFTMLDDPERRGWKVFSETSIAVLGGGS